MIPSRIVIALNGCRLTNTKLFSRSIASSNLHRCTKTEKVDERSQQEGVNSEAISQEVIRLTEENTNLSTKLLEIDGKYKRTLADRENVRNRLEKQITEAKQYGIQGFCKDLLEVTDIFEKAISTVPKKELETNNGLKNLYDGLVMTESTLQGVFRRHKLAKIELNVGDKFNPGEQEAMFEVTATDNMTPGTIAHILRPGWKLHNRCIRSAQVGVVKE